MKGFIFIGLLLMSLWSCEKSTPPNFTNSGGTANDNGNSSGDNSNGDGSNSSGPDYGGAYAGTVNARLVFAGWNYNRTSDSIVKNDTSFDFTVKVSNLGNSSIYVHTPDTTIDHIVVDDTGGFYLQYYKHNINGHFKGDSLIVTSNSVGGQYPLFYTSQRYDFRGKKN
jgi:hypothetical protein